MPSLIIDLRSPAPHCCRRQVRSAVGTVQCRTAPACTAQPARACVRVPGPSSVNPPPPTTPPTPPSTPPAAVSAAAAPCAPLRGTHNCPAPPVSSASASTPAPDLLAAADASPSPGPAPAFSGVGTSPVPGPAPASPTVGRLGVSMAMRATCDMPGGAAAPSDGAAPAFLLADRCWSVGSQQICLAPTVKPF